MGPARSTAATSPETTTWPGELKLAGTTTPASSDASRQTPSTTASSSPSTAAIVPGRARPDSSISSPRRRTVRTASAKAREPAAW